MILILQIAAGVFVGLIVLPLVVLFLWVRISDALSNARGDTAAGIKAFREGLKDD
jgi:hypothetical protein